MNKFAYLLALFLPWVAKAQFSRKDSLLGYLSSARTCYDVKHYDLHLRINPEKKFISGQNTITFLLNTDTQEIQVDLAPELHIKKILQQKKSLSFKREERAVWVRLSKKQKKGSTEKITIIYEGMPQEAKKAPWDGGFVWQKDKQGNPWIGVACQNVGASIWFPNKDHWSDKPDSVKLTYEVPQGLVAVANGNLVKTENLTDGYTRYVWKVSYPINNYNITLNVAKYTHFADTYTAQDGSKLALDYYVLPENVEKARKQFEQVKPMLACYEKLFDKYPFWNDGFALVETPYLGMEHQGAIAYGNRYLQGYLGGDLTGTGIGKLFDFIIIHETGHEYWGNSVSADDRAEMWIHEAFCTYTEALYIECMWGKAKAYEYANGWKKIIQNDKPILPPRNANQEGSDDMYFKGALMLHTLRNMIANDEKWFAYLKEFYQNFKGKNTNTDEVLAFWNKKTGMDLQPFFMQYLKFTQIPTFEYKIEGGKFQYRFKTDVKDFRMPIVVRFGSTEMTLNTSTEWETIIFDARGGNNSLLNEPFSVRTDLFFVNVQKK